MKVLCICPIGIGNYLMCYPAFSVLKKTMPGVSLQLLALREGIAEIARADPLWDDIVVFDPVAIGNDIPSALRIIADFRARRFDVSLNFFPSNTWQYHLLPWLAGIKKRFAFSYYIHHPSKLSFLCNYKVPVHVDLHDIQQNCRLVDSYTQKEKKDIFPVFPALFKEDDLTWAKRYLESVASKNVRIGIHPGSSNDHEMGAKRWAPDKFAALTDNVCRLFDGEALIFGGPDEKNIKTTVMAAMQSASHFVQPASLSKTAAMLSQCTLCICNDSGLMHMSACLGVATVGIFGPTDEKRNGPYGERTLVIRKTMEGFPVWTARNVGERSLKDNIDPQASLKALSVEEAWSQLHPWLSRLFKNIIPSNVK